ncbi:hypothetical protein CES86_5199 [Brucella lupini]|uniref:Uncharacterized protein n=1 Tax=Brucella lupini TaxID=255457 RepID=A0A256G9M4_9HYPH|nr:hypothetical protein CES86_5199 [Brucella lupini]
MFLNFQSYIHDIYPRKAAAAHPTQRLAALGGLRGSFGTFEDMI